MTPPLGWIKRKLFGSKIPEKEIIVEQIEHETARLNGAVDSLTREVDVVKRHRAEMRQVLDDTLQAMNKAYRR